MIVPLAIVTFTVKGNVSRPQLANGETREFTSLGERRLLLIMGVSALLFVPIFKTVTHLPPYLGMMFGLGVIWATTEVLHRKKPLEDRRKLTVIGVLRKVDVPTIFFFLGILLAVASLQSAGHLAVLANYLDEHFLGILLAVASLQSAGHLAVLANYLDENLHNIYAINLIIGILSAIVDNVPLVAGSMGMYDIADPGTMGYMADFVVDGKFFFFLFFQH